MKLLYKTHMSKAEAISEFKREVIPDLKAYDLRRGGTGKLSKTTIGSAWVEYIDALERAEYISEKQAENWDNPFHR